MCHTHAHACLSRSALDGVNSTKQRTNVQKIIVDSRAILSKSKLVSDTYRLPSLTDGFFAWNDDDLTATPVDRSGSGHERHVRVTLTVDSARPQSSQRYVTMARKPMREVTMSTLVTYRLENGIGTIAMDDGKRNVLSLEMIRQLSDALTRAEADRAVVVVRGREGAFSAGYDLRTLRSGGADANAMGRAGFELGERMLAFPRPIVVACTGHAIAMGAFLLLSGDYRLGAAGEFKIRANEVAIGITMPFFGVEICRARLAPAHFHRAVINAEIYRPEDAVAAGFLDRVVPASDLEDAGRTVAGALAGLDQAAHAATKLRARAGALEAIRAAIEADDDFFRAFR